MKASYNWIQDYIEEKLPAPEEVIGLLTLRAFEVENLEKKGDDFVFDVKVLPDRSHDCMSHYGLAKEVARLFGLKARELEMNFEANGPKTSGMLALEIKNPKCLRATKRVVSNIKIAEAPEFIRKRLEAVGQRTINNIVDIANFVMLETGQPVHTFDLDLLEGNKILIRPAENGEKIKTLDDKEFILDQDVLVISDEKKALDIAGIKGGKNSGISDFTKNVVLSACNFDPVSIRITSKKLGLRTDASSRFEQGLSPDLAEVALRRLSYLVNKYAGGEVSQDYIDIYPSERNPYRVGISKEEINNILGTDLSDGQIESIFGRLGFSFVKIENPRKNIIELAKEFLDVPYKFGASITKDSPHFFDCSSLSSYLHLLSGFAIPRMSVNQYAFGEAIKKNDLLPGDLIFTSSGMGKIYYETAWDKEEERFWFLKGRPVPEKGIDHVGIYLGENKVLHASKTKGRVIIDDLGESNGFKDPSGYSRLIPENPAPRYVVIISNERLDLRMKEDLAEEIGRMHGYENIRASKQKSSMAVMPNKIFYYGTLVRNILVGRGFSEAYNYSFAEKGEIELQNPLSSEYKFLRSDFISALKENLKQATYNAPLLGLEDIRIFEIGKIFEKSGPGPGPGRRSGERWELGLAVKNIFGKSKDKSATILAEAMQSIGEELDLDLKPFIKVPGLKGAKDEEMALIEFERLVAELPEPKGYDGLNLEKSEPVKYKKISAFPFVLRDVAVWVPDGVESEEVSKIIIANAGELLALDPKLFDQFNKNSRTSYAFHLVFQSYEKTLSDEEVGGPMKKIAKTFIDRGWEMR